MNCLIPRYRKLHQKKRLNGSQNLKTKAPPWTEEAKSTRKPKATKTKAAALAAAFVFVAFGLRVDFASSVQGGAFVFRFWLPFNLFFWCSFRYLGIKQFISLLLNLPFYSR